MEHTLVGFAVLLRQLCGSGSVKQTRNTPLFPGKSGELVSRIMTDVEGVRNLIGTGLVELSGGLLTATLSFVVLLWLSPPMTLLTLVSLGFFGLGLQPESPDWGSMINHGRPFVRLATTAHLALFPALSLMTLVLGLNLLADGLREESLKD